MDTQLFQQTVYLGAFLNKNGRCKFQCSSLMTSSAGQAKEHETVSSVIDSGTASERKRVLQC